MGSWQNRSEVEKMYAPLKYRYAILGFICYHMHPIPSAFFGKKIKTNTESWFFFRCHWNVHFFKMNFKNCT